MIPGRMIFVDLDAGPDMNHSSTFCRNAFAMTGLVLESIFGKPANVVAVVNTGLGKGLLTKANAGRWSSAVRKTARSSV